MRTLISFLGKGRDSVQTGYRTACYEFGPGERVDTPFFGLTLARREMPDRLLLLGTSGSMWDIFALADPEGLDSALSDELIEAVAAGRVDQALLDRVARAKRHGGGFSFEMLLIPYARNDVEQIEVLSLLAERVAAGERVLIDVTHGFRHLPMIALVAARYLAEARGAKIEQIYYGALEMASSGGVAPVLNLGGLLHLLDWIGCDSN